jgi:hypothetical protein
LLTKAIIKSINATGTRCTVEMPLFRSASSTAPIEAEALINVTPGVFNGLAVGDVVFIAFEENALEKPIILGKLFRGANIEGSIRGGGGVFNSLKVNNDAVIPSSTIFIFPANMKNEYKDFKTPKQIADYIKWLEGFTKSNLTQLEENFICFKNWTQWQLQAENVEIDDGDLDEQFDAEPFKYQNEGTDCKICKACTKENTRRYLKLPIDNTYPKT